MVAIRRKSTPASKTATGRYALLLPTVCAIAAKRRRIGITSVRTALPAEQDKQDQRDQRVRPGHRYRVMHFQKAAPFSYFPLTADLIRLPVSLWQRLSFLMATILSMQP